MMSIAPLCIIALLPGCAEWNAGLKAAARYKGSANDAQTRIWAAAACDQSLGGIAWERVL